MTLRSRRITMLGMAFAALVCLFPPRTSANGLAASRGFLFGDMSFGKVATAWTETDGSGRKAVGWQKMATTLDLGRFIAEVLFLCFATGALAIAVNREVWISLPIDRNES